MSKKTKSVREQIKEMEQKQREQAPPPPAKKPAPTTMSFDQWWMKVNKTMKFKPWLKEVLLADFKARGLGKEALESEYNAALDKFGYKLP